MLFSSISFIYFFLPIILILYYLTPRKYKNLTLLLGSLLFYFLGEAGYTFLLLASTFIDYCHSKIIVKHRGTKKAKIALISSIVMNLSMLIFFKYADFMVENINVLLGLNIPLLKVHLPIGISFFTFQTMSYTIDVYRNEAEVQHSMIGLGTYVSLFPQLIAGPIVRYKTIAESLESRNHSFHIFAYGVRRFIIGLAKKVLLANTLGELAQMVNYSHDLSILYYWMSAFAYSLQIYFDFSAYSDMAIGLGKMFGFHFLENFNYPYISKSITEFWRRWHMSLGQWFRDYVYIPLGGNRVSKKRWFFNIFFVWFLTGFWHGAEWNFIVWGLLFSFLLIVEKLWLSKYLKGPLSHVYVILVITISFVIFRYDLKDAFDYVKSMFGLSAIPLTSNEALYYLKSYKLLFLVAIIGSTPLLSNLLAKYEKVIAFFEPLVLMGILLVTTGYLVDSSFNPFLYFRF